MPRPNFEGVSIFKKSKNQYIIGTTNSDNDSAYKAFLFLFVGLHHLLHFDFGKSKKKKKKNYKSQKM